MALNASRNPLPPFTGLQPPPLPPRPSSAPPPVDPPTHSRTSSEDINTASWTMVSDTDDEEEELSEEQLREIYDNEEIERFINLFTAYVTEVRVPGMQLNNEGRDMMTTTTTESTLSSTMDTSQDSPWYDMNASMDSVAFERAAHPSISPESRSLAEIAAMDYLEPLLPLDANPVPKFSYGRFRLSLQRLYMALEPVYIHFLLKRVKLATWQNWNKRAQYCSIYWILWYSNLILPAIVLRTFYALIRRRMFPYPTLKELRERRVQADRASALGDYIQSQLTASSTLGMKELWRLFKVVNKTQKSKMKSSVKSKGKKASGSKSGGEEDPGTESCIDAESDLDSEKKLAREERNLQQLALHLIEGVADIMERLKNLFIWRRPKASKIYGAILFAVFLFTLFIPTQYISKATFFVLGVLFWHVMPIIASLPPKDRQRLPPAFSDLPTDADYATELISQRVAAGLEVRPTNTRRARREKRKDERGNISHIDRDGSPDVSNSSSVDWKKWGERVAIGHSWAKEGKRVLTTGKWPASENSAWPPRSAIVPTPGIAVAQPSGSTESHTYPAQHSSAPGLVTLTTVSLYFTPLMSTNAKVIIPLSSIRGVKKSGVLKGLYIKWANEEGQEREDKFLWCGGRDELFARLIGANGRQWIRG